MFDAKGSWRFLSDNTLCSGLNTLTTKRERGGRRMPPEKEPRKQQDETWKNLAFVSSSGITLVALSAAGLVAGRLIDAWLGTAPVFVLILFAVGTGGGFYRMFRDILKVGKSANDKPGPHD